MKVSNRNVPACIVSTILILVVTSTILTIRDFMTASPSFLQAQLSYQPNQHRQVHDGTITRPLCGVDAHSAEYTQGRWVYNSSITKYPYLGGKDYEWSPMCTEAEQEYLRSGKVPKFLKYQWQPDLCDLAQWNRDNFCKLLHGKTIGVIGDSMMQQFAHSLMGLMRGSTQDIGFFIPPDYNNQMVPLCPQTSYDVTLLFVRWNQYKPQPEDRKVLADLAQNADYLVLNWGVHYQPWKEREASALDFMKTLENSWQSKKFERIFWRSTVVAHANCSTATQPAREENDFAVHDNPSYNTDEILLQDERIIKPLFRYPPTGLIGVDGGNVQVQTQSLKNVSFFNVEKSTLLRPDGHRVKGRGDREDCLHYCEPGPTDHWIYLFYHHIVMGI